MPEQIKVISIDTCAEIQDQGAAAAKAMPPGRRYRYTQSAKLTLEDGHVIDWVFRGLTKPKLAEDIARNRRFMTEGALSASTFIGFEDKQVHWSLSWSIRLGVGS